MRHLDPYRWTIEDVQDFFRNDAVDCIADMPHARLPPLDRLLAKFEEQEVSGSVLFTVIDNTTLRDDCNVPVLGHRSAILHCIAKLRKQSEAYNAQQAPKAPTLAIPPTPPAAPTDTPTQTPALPEFQDAVGPRENNRMGEVEFRDVQGRKRRKLDLSANKAAILGDIRASAVPKALLAKPGYLSDPPCPVDEIFYGHTPCGEIIGELDPPPEVLVLRTDKDAGLDDRNFQFTNHSKAAGESQYVCAKLLHFLMSEAAIQLQRNGREALAYLPYRENGTQQNPSATVIEFQAGHEEPVARREAVTIQGDAVHFRIEHFGDAPGANEPSEWDFLMRKYPENDGSLLPSETAQDGASAALDDEKQEIYEDSDDNEDSDMASVEEDKAGLSPQQVVQVCEAFVEECTAKWYTRLLDLETKKAWTVWKKMKNSRTLRDGLIENAHTQILRLTQRLQKMKDKFLEDKWKDEPSVRQQCVILEPTVHELEEQRWKITIWQRRREPDHIHSHSLKGQSINKQVDSGNGVATTLYIPPEDRFSTSPPPTVDTSEANAATLKNNEHHVVEEPLEARSGTYLDPSGDGSVSPKDSRQSSPLGDFVISTPPDLMTTDTDGKNEGDVSMDGPSGQDLTHDPNEPIDGPSNAVFDDATPEEVVKSESSSYKPDEPEEEGPESEDLPSLRELVPPAKKTPSRPGIQPIDLTLDDSDSPPSKHASQCTPAASSLPTRVKGEISDVTVTDVASWSYDMLFENNDRMRILMKLLHEAGMQFQGYAHECLRRLTPTPFSTKLESAVRDYRDGNVNSDLPNDPNSNDFATMAQMARIYVCWVVPCPPQQACPDLNKETWVGILNHNQFRLFTTMLSKILSGKAKHLGFQVQKHFKAGSSSAPIDITSEIESSEGPRTAKSRSQRRKQKRSATAMNQRSNALKRAQDFETQTTDSARLLEMMNDPSSSSNIDINPVKTAENESIFIDKNIARQMKPHQVDGVRFMWRELTAEEDPKGCILAHTMGLGKTMQTITVLVALYEASQSEEVAITRQLPKRFQKPNIRNKDRIIRTLILCPATLKDNWLSEINKWAKGKLGPATIVDQMNGALTALKRWKNEGGLLLIGYELFRILLTGKNPGRSRGSDDEELKAAEVAKFEKLLLECPDIVVADEAHTLKNDGATITKLAKKFKTHSRIALTGTPMSNDVDEIYALVSWVAPGFFGDPAEFTGYFSTPIKEGLYSDSTAHQKRRSLMRLQVLHSEIAPKVDRANIEVLRGSLKTKTEFVITLSLTKIQHDLYSRFIKVIRGERTESASNVAIFGWLNDLTLLTTHPRCLRRKLLYPPAPAKKKRANLMEAEYRDRSPSIDPEDEAATPTPRDSTTPEVDIDDEDAQQAGSVLSPSEIAAVLDGLEDDLDPAFSAKATVFHDLLQLCIQAKDKVLVFSNSLQTLDYVGQLLETNNMMYGRIDGKVQVQKRMPLIQRFESGEFDVMLISTKAGGVGLNIHAANRVFILDVKWNPSVEEQAIGRAYRLGQQKPVFVYRLLTGGTFEKNLYDQQLFKTSLAQRVVDKKKPRRNAARDARDYLYEPKEIRQESLDDEVGNDPLVLDQVLQGNASALSRSLIRSIKTMETLQEDAQDAPLDAEEQRQVEEEIKHIKQRGRGPGRFPMLPPIAAHASPYVPPSTAPWAFGGPITVDSFGTSSTMPPPTNMSSTQPAANTERVSTTPPSVSASQPGAVLGGLPSPVAPGKYPH